MLRGGRRTASVCCIMCISLFNVRVVWVCVCNTYNKKCVRQNHMASSRNTFEYVCLCLYEWLWYSRHFAAHIHTSPHHKHKYTHTYIHSTIESTTSSFVVFTNGVGFGYLLCALRFLQAIIGARPLHSIVRIISPDSVGFFVHIY